MEKTNQDFQNSKMSDAEEDAYLSKNLKQAREHTAYVKEIEAIIGKRRNPIDAHLYITPQSRSKWRIYFIVTAVICLLGLAFWWSNQREKDGKAREKVQIQQPKQSNQPIAAVIDKHLENTIARTATLGATTDKDVKTLYKQGKDVEIIALLEPKGSKRSQEETFVLTKSYAQKQQYDKIVSCLQAFNFNAYEDGAEVQWLYALALLKRDKKTEAMVELQVIQQSNKSMPARKKESQDLLEQLKTE